MIKDTSGTPLPRTAFCYNCGSAHGVPFWWKSRVPRGEEPTPFCRWWFVSSDRRAYSSLCRECGLSLDVDAALEKFREEVRSAVAEYRRRGGVIQPGCEDFVPPYTVPIPATTWPPDPRLGLVEPSAPGPDAERPSSGCRARGVGQTSRTRRPKRRCVRERESRGRAFKAVGVLVSDGEAGEQLEVSDSVSSAASEAIKGRGDGVKTMAAPPSESAGLNLGLRRKRVGRG